MKYFITLVSLVLVGLAVMNFTTSTTMTTTENTVYQFKVEDINGQSFDFSTLKGKKIMIVNTASKCGLTPQYEELEKLFKNLRVYRL